MKRTYILIYGLIILLIININIDVFGQTWVKVACGGEYSMALRSDGTIWGWGANLSGQLGINGTVTTQNYSLQAGTDNDWKDLAVGAFHTLALKSNGTLWAWGENGNGQLGDGTNNNKRIAPVQIGTDNDWKVIDGGYAHSMAIKTNGTLWAWGFNYGGQLGDNTLTDKYAPTQIGTDNKWASVACGGYHTLAVKTDGTLWAWGWNEQGQVGVGSIVTTPVGNVPQQVGSATNWDNVSAGFEFSIGIKKDGTIWGWGMNQNNQLGDGTTTQRPAPYQIGSDNDWAKIVAGAGNAFAIKTDSTLWGWGYNGLGQLGDGTTTQRPSPGRIEVDNSWHSVAAAKGFVYNSSLYGFHTLGLKYPKNVICATGANYGGQLGDTSTTNRNQFGCDIDKLTVGITEAKAKAEVKVNCYPNPVNQLSVISYQLPVRCHVNLKVYDFAGRVIALLADENKERGEYKVNFNSQNLQNGLYFYSLTAGNSLITRKIVVTNN
jgi:alpha-tubulin suppressor-like RCC1 family protein